MEHGATLADGRYVLRERLGAGGMATVYRAEDTRLGVERAIKVLKPDFLKSRSVTARFEREARVMARLEHPNVVPVHDIAQEGHHVYLVMSLLPAGSLHDHLERFGPLAPRVAVHAVLGVLAAVEAAHDLGIVHRDIKPHNVLVDGRGTPRLTDFGIAHDAEDRSLTKTGALMGTWAYMAPEQRVGQRVDTRADVYAVGGLLAALLTGSEPHDLHNPESHGQQLEGVPHALRTVVEQACRFFPDDRFQTAREARAALEACLVHLPPDPEGTPRLGSGWQAPGELPPAPTGGTQETLLAFLDQDTPAPSSPERAISASNSETRVPLADADAPTELRGQGADTELLQPHQLPSTAAPPVPRSPPAPSRAPLGLVAAGVLTVVVLGALGIGAVSGGLVGWSAGSVSPPDPARAVPSQAPHAVPPPAPEPAVPTPPPDPVSTPPRPAEPVERPRGPLPTPAPARVVPEPAVAPAPDPAPAPAVGPAPAPIPAPEALPGVPLTISSDPWGAEVRIDGTVVGVTPHTASLAPGSYGVTVTDPSGRTGYRRVTVGDAAVSFCWDFAASGVCR